MLLQLVVALLILGTGMYLSVKAQKLTPGAAALGGVLGLAIFLGAGFTGLLFLSLFFVAGTAATSWQMNRKINLGLAEENKGRRQASQVWANGGLGGLLGLAAFLYPPQAEIYRLMLAAGFAAATADTLSSELGNLYGRRYYHVLTFRPGTRGRNGVVSLEGTLLGLAGTLLPAFVYGFSFGWGLEVGIIVVSGAIGNLTDSVLGATLENRGLLSNDAVNFLNTAAGALTALLLFLALAG